MVAQAGAEQQEALTDLCRTYWPPVYAYLRRSGASPADAQDLTQEFFSRLLAREFFARADRERGRFCTFLLCSLQNFLRDQHARAKAEKRGAGRVVSLDELAAEQAYQAEPLDTATAETLFERRGALTLLEGVLARLEAEFNQGARPGPFPELRQRLWGGTRGEPAHTLAQPKDSKHDSGNPAGGEHGLTLARRIFAEKPASAVFSEYPPRNPVPQKRQASATRCEFRPGLSSEIEALDMCWSR